MSFRPSGGIPNPNDSAGISRIGDAAVFGVTTTIRYYAIAGFAPGFGCRDSASTISAANMQSAPATKNAGR